MIKSYSEIRAISRGNQAISGGLEYPVEEIREEQKAATPEEIAADLDLENSVGSDMAMSLGF